MSTAESSKENSASTNPENDAENQDISSFAQDALKEVLGWYGLQENERCSHSPGGSSCVTPSSTSGSPSLSTGEPSQGPDDPDDTDRGQHPRGMPGAGVEQALETLANCGSSSSSTSRSRSSSSRKLIGMRYLFPPLGDDLSLLDKAVIWVARHDHKYFVGWGEEQLSKVDRVLRPLGTISPQLYKLHMNRSEFCRNVKLKYCLESNASWAEEFRMKLAKSSTDGGFSGLCQAKIAAAELWRKYSDKYKSHQARYPNPKSRERDHTLAPDCWQDVLEGKRPDSGGEEGENDEPPHKRSKADMEAQEEVCCAEADDEEAEECGVKTNGNEEVNEAASGSQSMEKVEEKVKVEQPKDDDTDTQRLKDTPMKDEPNCPESCPDGGQLEVQTPTPSSTPASMSNPATPQPAPLTPHIMEQMQAGMHPFSLPPGVRMPGIPGVNMGYGFDPYMDVLMQFPHMDPRHAGVPLSHQGASTTETTLTRSRSAKSLHSSRSSDYKRSERGLSYLFPSLSEHNLSLLDKVKVTVIRHKNNYFLDWPEEQLSQLDPLIRPKMPVTPELYKEYCHRNAMKYDSNLQFAMESPEPWAQGFRAKLMKPPSHGGFSSLCEVKLEAGRLWRQYSGKYRMHNIVKWHMDLNSATASVQPDEPGGQSEHKTEPTELQPKDHVENLRHSKKKSLSSPSLHTTSTKDTVPQATLHKVPNEQSGSSDRAKVHSRLRHRVDSRSLLADSRTGSNQVATARADTDVRAASVSAVDHNENSVHATALHTEDMMHKSRKTPIDYSTTTAGDSSFKPGMEDCLFRPLPKYLSVFDQVCIWLERHRHNYFLGYPPHKLAEIPEIVRPQMLVTETVFKRYVPESMVDVISKIDLMISCDTGWSRDFQDNLQKGREDGGFATFEEALTEAVMVWESSQARLLASGWLREAADGANNTTRSSSPRVLDTTADAIDYESAMRKKGKTSDKQSWGESAGDLDPAQGQGHEVQNNPSKSFPRCTTVVKQTEPENTSSTDTPNQRIVSSSRSLEVEAEGTREQRSEAAATILWASRDSLQQLCEDNPSQSWHRRMQPFLPTLERHLGSDYICPPTATQCLVDLFLAVIQREFDHNQPH